MVVTPLVQVPITFVPKVPTGLSYLGNRSSKPYPLEHTPRRVPAVTPRGPSGPLKHRAHAHRYHRLPHPLQEHFRMVTVCSAASIFTVTEPDLFPSPPAQTAWACPRPAAHLPIAPAGGRGKRPAPSCFPIMVRSKPCISSFFFFPFLSPSCGPLVPLRLKTLSLQILYRLREVHDKTTTPRSRVGYITPVSSTASFPLQPPPPLP